MQLKGYYFLLLAAAFFTLAIPASAQEASQVALYSESAANPGPSSFAPVDSIYYYSGDDEYQFSIGFGYPESGDPADVLPYDIAVLFTVPEDEEAFVLNSARLRYRTATLDAATGTYYEAQEQPRLLLYEGDGTDPDASTLLMEMDLPFSTATNDDLAPILEDFYVELDESFTFEPSEEFWIRLSFTGVPYPAGVEAGMEGEPQGRSFSLSSTGVWGTLDLLTFNGPGEDDTAGADGLLDTWVMAAVFDDEIVANEGDATPQAFEFVGVYPNPFQSSATVTLRADEPAANVTVKAYDVLGREVAVLQDGPLSASTHYFNLDGSNLPSGVYLVSVRSGDFSQTQKVVLID